MKIQALLGQDGTESHGGVSEPPLRLVARIGPPEVECRHSQREGPIPRQTDRLHETSA